MTAPQAGALAAEEPAANADAAIANTQALVDPIRRCKPAESDEIVVCGSDTERYRLPPELRAIANEGREAPPKLPRAEAKAMSLDRLPYNWATIGGRYPPGPEYNALYELMKRRTDPEADGSAPPGEGEP
ncbi:hypothetical protein [Sphingopyxis flava]|uniref:hypothetical protein n=1 Tax=Sphingopyxis flava TaxID=1507287 RepID=UPI001FE5E6F4|nr:hypothetical protein [Sphingopyxis flava]